MPEDKRTYSSTYQSDRPEEFHNSAIDSQYVGIGSGIAFELSLVSGLNISLITFSPASTITGRWKQYTINVQLVSVTVGARLNDRFGVRVIYTVSCRFRFPRHACEPKEFRHFLEFSPKIRPSR